MRQIPEVGDMVTVRSYAYSNMQGGTELVEDVLVDCTITKAWHDYECGWRYWARPKDKGLLKGKSKSPDVIYISEFEVVSRAKKGNRKYLFDAKDITENPVLIISLSEYKGNDTELRVKPNPLFMVVDAKTGEEVDNGYRSFEEAQEAWSDADIVNRKVMMHDE